MKLINKRSFVFFGKSLVWSLLLYAITMITLNWEEVRNNINGTTCLAKISTNTSETQNTDVNEKNISEKPSILKIAATIMHAIMGVTSENKSN